MSKRPELYLVEGRAAPVESRLYRLRAVNARSAPIEAVWPEAGAWRDLVHRLLGNPIKGDAGCS
jgi:hypothetical protein